MPSPGDLTICLYCGGINQFTEDMQLMKAHDCLITEEAMMMSLLYYKPVVRDGGKVH